VANAYQELRERLRAAATLGSAAALLEWDQETMMPPEAAGLRAEQLAMLSRLAHERLTDPRIGELLEACESDEDLLADPREAANVREIRRDYDRATRLPASLVAEMSETSSLALQAWKEARRESEFDRFRPWLEKQIDLNRRKAECYGSPEGGELYDALVEDYEPGMTASELERIFGPLRETLAPMISEVAASSRRLSDDPQNVKLPISKQQEFCRFVAGRLGYRFDAGRLDTSTHPFTEGVGPGDTRITTRYHETGFTEALGSTMHEVGHALYEQGLPKNERHGEPLGQAAGLGVHESQSRIWENHVGRSRSFWEWALPEAKRVFGPALAPFSADDLYRSVNLVKPNLIRVESDEATYNLHIMIRFDAERALLRGDLDVVDLPGFWNQRMRDDLGLEVPDDARGCLQDIHWSMGSIGYFPTYTLGNLCAAQLWEAAVRSTPDLESRLARGEFDALLGWLRENVHACGRRHRTPELCQRLTGRPLEHRPLVEHLRGKLRDVYGI
jgi:carboxypeptidase Taq